MLDAAILAGGLGTRLRSAIGDKQKVAAEVAGRPFVTHLLDALARQGVRRTVLCVGYQADAVRELLGDRYAGMQLEWSIEEAPLGTAGALALARERLSESAPTLVLNGDSYCDVDLGAFVAAHERRTPRASLVSVEVTDASRYGTLELDDASWVRGFHEKREGAGAGPINAGVYCVSPQLLGSLPLGRACSLEREIFPSLLDTALFAYAGGGAFIDIGTPDSYRAASAFMSSQGDADGALGRGRLVLIDRDGTVNREVHHLSSIEQLELLPGSTHALRRLRSLGFRLAVVTNQAIIGRGGLSERELDAIHARLSELLAAQGARVDAIYYCPHRPEDNCACRKPRAALAERAAAELGGELREAFMIGDHASDMAMGRAVGATTIQVRTGHGERFAQEAAQYTDHRAEDLWCAALIVERLARQKGAVP